MTAVFVACALSMLLVVVVLTVLAAASPGHPSQPWGRALLAVLTAGTLVTGAPIVWGLIT